MYDKTYYLSIKGFNWSLLGRRIVIALIILLNIITNPFMMPSVYADPTSVSGETAEGVFGEGTGGQGQPEPDSKTGAMTWTYPFSLPAARGGPQPKLALSYNSSSHDREAGYGWGLDLPVIERKPLSGNPCFAPGGTPIVCGEQSSNTSGTSIRSEERYTYNGQPLVFICQLQISEGGKAPGCDDEDQPRDWLPSSGWRYFRLQSEGQFARFYLSENRRYWRVQLKGGELLEFGEPPNSNTRGIEHAFGNKNAILRWRLVRHSDAVHTLSGSPFNYINYRWKELGKRGLLYLTDIYDTPRSLNSADGDFAHHTQLTWQLPDFAQTFYADPYRATPDLRLSRVAVASAPWSGIGPREVIRTYLLTYAVKQDTQPTVPTRYDAPRFQIWHHSFLSEIQMEGRCNQLEDEQGNIPKNRECPNRLPPTTFEYEGANVAFAAAFPTQVQADPLNVVDENRVLPYLKSVGVVDFNRDGLPDIVQSWNSEVCIPRDKDDQVLVPGRIYNFDQTFPIKVSTRYIDALECAYKSEFGAVYRPFQSTRPILGYLNRGIAPGVGNVKLDYQCMDAGRIDDKTGLTYHNSERIPGFFTNQGAATLLGSWGEGVLAWSNALYAPYRAKPLLSGAKLGEFEPGTGCDADNFKEPDFHPGWKWEKTQDKDWAKLPPVAPGPNRWFTDIDGDGLTDLLTSTGQPLLDFEQAYVEFTQRYAKGYLSEDSASAQIPFVLDGNQLPHSLAPSVEGAKRGTKYYYVDMNGDGLVDLVTHNPADSSGIPLVRPGDGHGEFACIDSQQPWPCQELPSEVSRIYEIEVPGAYKPWPFNEDTFFHDVTGDGLADIVKYDMSSGDVRLWVNQDGHTFACVAGSAAKPCWVGIVLDERTGKFNIGDHRTTFADMNADGTDDIVILANRGAYVGTFMNTPPSLSLIGGGGAPKPGLLTRIHNGRGATTDIEYKTIQQLDLAAKNSANAWEYHSPVIENVVTQIITQDSYHAENLNGTQFPAPYQFKRTAQYLYQNPAYDRWSRSFMGFRKVIAHYGDEKATTATTYWFGPCQNNGLNARLPGSDSPLCNKGSDNDYYKSLTGRVVRIDRGNELLGAFPIRQQEGPQLLWTKIFQYSNGTLFTRPDRRVMFSYPSKIDTYLYDETQPTTPSGKISPLGGNAIEGSDEFTDAPHQVNIRKHLSKRVEYDKRGNLTKVTDEGAIIDQGESNPNDIPDTTTVTLFSSKNKFDFSNDGPSRLDDTNGLIECNSNWQCLPDFVSIWKPEPIQGDSSHAVPLRKSRFTYSPTTGDVKSVEGWLKDDSISLDRHNPAGANNIAPEPSGQSLDRGWHKFATLSYDNWGNVIQTVSGQALGGSPPTCTEIAYDEPYQHLPSVVRSFKDGCGGTALETESVFDRGFEQVISSTAPSGDSSEFRYDPFGRVQELYSPDPDAPAGTRNTVLAATIAYSDRNPLSYVDVQQIVSPGKSIRAVSLLNGLGETVVAFDQGDNKDWILNGWTETNKTGQVEKVRRPWRFTGDPIATAVNAKSIPIPADNSSFEMGYDSFGRRVSIQEKGSSFSQEMMRTRYFPLAIETRDAEQIKPGGLHANAFQRVEFDGHGRSTKSVEHMGNPSLNDIVTTVEYEPTGEPSAITRTHANGTYRREMAFDSLGRLMLNKEPNTGNNWRYVWDDAGRLVGTSDARGCGVNYHYDGLSRLIGEDYSPCLTSQPVYTPPNFVTGKGFETFYRYDEYEADQVSPEPGFADESRLAIGNLVSVSDRGSHTRFNYDPRNRVRRIARQIAKPSGLTTDLPYAPHWFTSRLDYDLGDRLTRRTTGADVEELLLGGASEERYAYSPRGQLSAIDSSYGAIVKSMTYDPDGVPRRIVYGDRRSTTANFDYDSRRRLTQYQLGTPFGGGRFSVLPVEHFDYRFSAYDEVGNPLKIEDQHTPLTLGTVLPPEAAPVKLRQMQYDDLYRLTQIDSTYSTANGNAPWRSPLGAEVNAGDNHPVPLRTLPTRVKQQTFDYDGLGNITASSDDLSARYDRSLGSNLGYGTPNDGPNQLRSGEGLQVRYDAAGNLTELKLERPGSCPTGTADQCAQWFAYDWDEVGQLTRARRWDFDGNALPPQATPDTLPTEKPSWDLTYAYSQGMRVRKSVGDAADITKHTLEVFDTLRIEQAPFNSVAGDYQARRYNVHVYPGGMAHAFWDADGTLPHQAPNSAIAMHLIVGDHLGSSSVVINHTTSQLVERTTYQPYGAVESDYRPAKWKSFREPYKFTGKEEDIEVGATYFGVRYYQPYLGRFMSADPLTIHGLGSDLNPYAYVGGQVMTNVDPLGLDRTDVTRTDWCAPGYCDGELPNDHAMNASRAEAMADQSGARRLDTLNRSGSKDLSTLPNHDQKLLGIPPEGRSTDRLLEAQMKCKDDPVCNRVWLVAGAGAITAPFWLEAAPVGGLLFARGGISALALSFYVRGGLFVSGAGAGGIGVVASNERLGNYGVRTAPIYQGVYNSFRSNPSSIYGLVPKLSLNFINLGVRVPRLFPAVWGKAFELFSVQATPNLVRQLGGANQADAIIRVGNQSVNVDWTTWGSLEQHLERSYYQLDQLDKIKPFIIYLYQ
jgi:RHS repeat-associated protein